MDLVHGAVDCGATSPPWTGGHCRAWELTGAQPLAALVPKSSGQGAEEGKEGSVSSGAREMRWGGYRGSVRVAGCWGTFYRAEGRSGGGQPLKGRWRHSGAPL
jgi:hypothetical protein